MNNEKLERCEYLRNSIKTIIREIKRLKGIDYKEKYLLFACNGCDFMPIDDLSRYKIGYFISEPLFNSTKNRLINNMRIKLVELQNEFQNL